jgi:hypothetical protein
MRRQEPWRFFGKAVWQRQAMGRRRIHGTAGFRIGNERVGRTVDCVEIDVATTFDCPAAKCYEEPVATRWEKPMASGSKIKWIDISIVLILAGLALGMFLLGVRWENFIR